MITERGDPVWLLICVQAAPVLHQFALVERRPLYRQSQGAGR
jgi:hypothetical protein